MTASHSFKEYVANTFDSQFWEAAVQLIEEYPDAEQLDSEKLHRPGKPEISCVAVEHIWAESLSDINI
ncbi:MAG TPA: hypothetical protein PLN48_17205 [Lachnospiraceae bacterium]|nr:hypothetical protein [Lachnospiraceae bacterium]